MKPENLYSMKYAGNLVAYIMYKYNFNYTLRFEEKKLEIKV